MRGLKGLLIRKIAAAYLYLFGNAYSTGSAIVVDGGVTC